MTSELAGVYLDLAAAKAKQLAEDTKHHRLWDGDLEHGIAEIEESLRKALSEYQHK